MKVAPRYKLQRLFILMINTDNYRLHLEAYISELSLFEHIASTFGSIEPS